MTQLAARIDVPPGLALLLETPVRSPGGGRDTVHTGSARLRPCRVGGVVSADNVLVLQLTEGKFTAFDAICPHQAFRISPPDDKGVITCQGHNSHFKASDGSFIDGPAPSGLKPVQVQVREGYVVKLTG